MNIHTGDVGLLDDIDEFFDIDQLLFSALHVLKGEFSFCHLILSCQNDIRDLLDIGVRHLLLHLR